MKKKIIDIVIDGLCAGLCSYASMWIFYWIHIKDRIDMNENRITNLRHSQDLATLRLNNFGDAFHDLYELKHEEKLKSEDDLKHYLED